MVYNLCMTTFKPFPKIPRYTSNIIVTEKIDGTNASILITKNEGVENSFNMEACSKNRILSPGKDDNFGFAKWVEDNAYELIKLGPGQHYGEWYGQGINRGYGLEERRFALFNVNRWRIPEDNYKLAPGLPNCVEVVPVIGEGEYSDKNLEGLMAYLRRRGSYAVGDYMDPEGIILMHQRSKQLFKKTFDQPKYTLSEMDKELKKVLGDSTDANL